MTATVLQFPTLRPNDGGKARIKAKRQTSGLAAPTAPTPQDSLIMDHADPEVDTRPSEMA